MKFFCIADEDTVRGFRLAGVAGEAVGSPLEAGEALRRAITQPEYAILILTETVAAGVRPLVEALRLERDQPLLVEIPGPEGPAPGHRSLGRLVQEAVGISVDGREGA